MLCARYNDPSPAQSVGSPAPKKNNMPGARPRQEVGLPREKKPAAAQLASPAPRRTMAANSVQYNRRPSAVPGGKSAIQTPPAVDLKRCRPGASRPELELHPGSQSRHNARYGRHKETVSVFPHLCCSRFILLGPLLEKTDADCSRRSHYAQQRSPEATADR